MLRIGAILKASVLHARGGTLHLTLASDKTVFISPESYTLLYLLCPEEGPWNKRWRELSAARVWRHAGSSFLPFSGRQLGGVERVVGVQPRVRAPEGPGVRRAPAQERGQVLRGAEPGGRELHRGAVRPRWVTVLGRI